MPIEVTNLYHSYKEGTPFEQMALHDVSLTIGDGEFIGIIGPTRAGKTTLAQHLNALHIPRRGRVIVDGQDTADRKTDLVSLRHRVGYVFQNPENQLFASTVGEDVAFGPLNQGLGRPEREQRTREALDQVGLDYEEFRGRDIYALSGGQKRRAAIAGVLACRPDVLVLDDVTAGLDPRGRDEILRVVQGLHREQKITIVFVSSSMDEAVELAGRIVVLDRGRIALEGTPGQVCSRTAELRAIGLEPPAVSVIAERLRAKGLDLPPGMISLDETVAAISACLRAGGVQPRWN